MRLYHAKKLLDMVRNEVLQPVFLVYGLSVSDIQKRIRMLQVKKLIGKVVCDPDEPEALIPVSIASNLSVYLPMCS